ncbi:fibronectin type III domain-containing protein [Paenibacillus sp. FSL H7-0331]|uniref:RCC1 domain-containing protein n=1 Tax=Paenibacillus sp. FSL H7-0331 TaxID=1920421 RepID=UPI002116F936|nr:fibronectin type III domain-containing protein [Paenibacillus sp. FSL H7-0331]
MLVLFFALMMVSMVSIISSASAEDKYSENLIPVMTSATTPSGKVTSSSAYSSTPTWKGFDGNKNYYVNSEKGYEAWGAPTATGWLAYEFPAQKTISKYVISYGKTVANGYNNGMNPKDWTFEGSNNGTNWVVLDTQSNITSWTEDEEKSFVFDNNTPYKIYRINISANNGSLNTNVKVTVHELGMMEKLQPSTPALTAVGGDAKIDLSWAPTSGATGYNIKRSTISGGPYTTVASNVYGSPYIDTTVTNGITYYYIVTGLNERGESGYSNEASATPTSKIKVNLIDAGGDSFIVLKPNGTVWTGGNSAITQVKGTGGIGYLTDIKSVSGGFLQNAVVKSDGTVWAWGQNLFGELGDGTTITRNTPVQVVGPGGVGYLDGVAAIDSSVYFNAALKSDGTVWTWGQNLTGQLGAVSPNRYNPIQVQGAGGIGFLTDVVAIAVGSKHVLALKQDGTVWSWGDYWEGQLGDGSPIGSNNQGKSRPAQVKNVGGIGYLTDVVAISAGGDHSMALKSDGTVYAWGNNSFYTLGDGTIIRSSTPVQVKGVNGVGNLSDVVGIAASSSHSLIVKSDGTVWSWGYNANGQLGAGSTVSMAMYPLQVKGALGEGYLSDIIIVAASNNKNVALKSDGSVYCWGGTAATTCGQPTPIKNVPVKIPNLDLLSPSAPFNLVTSEITASSTRLSWNANPSAEGVVTYEIYKGDVVIGSTESTTFVVDNLEPNTNYTFTIKAIDASGNTSIKSNVVNVSTL